MVILMDPAWADNLVSLYRLGLGLCTSDEKNRKKNSGSGLNKLEVNISSYFRILEIVGKELDLGSLETGTQAPLSLLRYVSCHSQDHNMTQDGCQSSSNCFCIPAKKEKRGQRRVLVLSKDMSQNLNTLLPLTLH